MTLSNAPTSFDRLPAIAAALTAAVQAMPSRSFVGLVPRPAEHRSGRRWLVGLCDLVLTWHERARQRRQLMAMDDHQLRDIGISRADALGEGLQPFWRS
jgi:uncharacterized protein YjiS (DUF1127 family)